MFGGLVRPGISFDARECEKRLDVEIDALPEPPLSLSA
jgi:hypothetical protein